ncbi:MAG: hypothetical protein ACTSX8_07960 [Alphaproteobacteria bacterium]
MDEKIFEGLTALNDWCEANNIDLADPQATITCPTCQGEMESNKVSSIGKAMDK